MVGNVKNIDGIEKNISTLSLNDKVKYIIDLLNNAETSKVSNAKFIIGLLETILSKLKDDGNANNNNSLNEINKSVKSIHKELEKINIDMREIKSSIM